MIRYDTDIMKAAARVHPPSADVRFTPESGHCGARLAFRFVPQADIGKENIRSGSVSGSPGPAKLSAAAAPVVGAPDIEDVQYRAIGRCGPGALGDRFCQQAFQFAKIANLRANVIEMMRSDPANFSA